MSVLVALVAGIGLLSTNTAYAQRAGAGLGVVQGSGTISPGLTALPTPQTVSFGGMVTGAFGAVSAMPAATAADIGTINCSFNGASGTVTTVNGTPVLGGDNYAAGYGTVTGNCSGNGIVTGAPITVDCGVMTYVRVGPIVIVVAVKCNITVGSITVLVTVTGAFVFTPNTPPPGTVQSYTLVGVAAAAGVNP